MFFHLNRTYSDRPASFGARRPGVHVAMCLVYLLLLVVVPGRWACADLNFAYGFDGHAKAQKWFPIKLLDAPLDMAGFDVYLMQEDWCGRSPKRLLHFTGGASEGPSGRDTILVKIPELWGGSLFFQCVVTRMDGTLERKNIPARAMTENDLLVMVAGMSCADYEFLGGIDRPGRGIVRVVARDVETFPASWQMLDSVDVVILDGGGAGKYAPAQKTALLRWVMAGGTVILTDRGILEEAGAAGWGVFPEITSAGAKRQCHTDTIGQLIGKAAAHFAAMPALPINADPGMRCWPADDDAVFIAAKDFGHGRVIASGLDWRDINLSDRVHFDVVRKAVWTRLLDLRRQAKPPAVERAGVYPREVNAKSLAKPLGVFLLAYFLLLGPVNWLVLRVLGKQEYMVLSLPAGALLFSIAAFFIGGALRTNDPVLYESELLFAGKGTEGLAAGLAGLLSPDSRPYVMTLAGDAARLDLESRRHHYGADGDALKGVRAGDILTFAGARQPRIENIRMRTWSMRFFDAKSFVGLGAGITAVADCTRTSMTGVVESRLPFDLKDAWIMHRWNRLAIGDVPAGAIRRFDMPLVQPGRALALLCPHCRHFHNNTGWLTEEFCARYPLAPDVREFLECLDGWYALDYTVIVGWHAAPGGAVSIDSPPARHERRRLCVIPVDLRLAGPDVHVPGGLVPATPITMDFRYLNALHVNQLAARLAVMDPAVMEGAARADGDDVGHRYFAGRESPMRPVLYDYYLPVTAAVTALSLHVYWDLGDADPDWPASEFRLAIFNWVDREWETLLNASVGEHELEVAQPAPMVGPARPMVRLQITPVSPDAKIRHFRNAPEITFTGRLEK